MNYKEACQILGVSVNDDLDSIKKVYRSRIKFYHPDNFQESSEKVEYAEAMTKNINEAWEYIQQNYSNKSQEALDNKKYQNKTDEAEDESIYTYTYPLYEPVFTKAMLITTIIIFSVIALVAAGFALKPVFEDIELRANYSEEEIALMEDFDFDAVYDGYKIDTKHSGFSGFVVIPNSFDGEPVSEIAEGAFKGYKEITEITIPEGIVIIGKSAFADCDNIKGVKIPDSVKELGSVTFADRGVFEGCDGLESIHIGKGIESLTYHTFANCVNLKNIYLTSNTKGIEAYTFSGCDNISNIYYGGTMEQWNTVNVDKMAFESGLSLTIHCSDGTIVDNVN